MNPNWKYNLNLIKYPIRYFYLKSWASKILHPYFVLPSEFIFILTVLCGLSKILPILPKPNENDSLFWHIIQYHGFLSVVYQIQIKKKFSRNILLTNTPSQLIKKNIKQFLKWNKLNLKLKAIEIGFSVTNIFPIQLLVEFNCWWKSG